MNAETIEQIYAEKYNTSTTSRKDIGDIYVDGVPINIKSSCVGKNNYSPNLSVLISYLNILAIQITI